MDEGFNVPQATKQVLSRLDGSWALAVINSVALLAVIRFYMTFYSH